MQDCPLLLADLVQLRGSICFKSLFVPGVCCPDDPFAVLQPQQQGQQQVGLLPHQSQQEGQQQQGQQQQGLEAPVLPPPPPPPSLPSIADLPPADLGPDFVPAETIQHNVVPGTSAGTIYRTSVLYLHQKAPTFAFLFIAFYSLWCCKSTSGANCRRK